ncbi:MSHA biogenesis protein MshQ [Shewanella sp. AS1]|nr:DUF6701 domain-containing protein [Shewanella sp. AS1]MCE9679794.1 MSHA biogenesis protein MshQ [Shewanella sp. AS1]
MQASAAPQCNDIFKDPPRGNIQPGLIPPANIGPSLGLLDCSNGSCTPVAYDPSTYEFQPGDYNYSSGRFHQGNYVKTSGRTTRLYFDTLSINNSNINLGGDASELIIFVRNALSLAGHVSINGIIYVGGSVDIQPQTIIDGAVASGGALALHNKSEVNFDQDAVDKADFGGMCNQGPVSVDHYRIEFSSDALSCTAKSIGLRACVNDACSTEATVTSSVELTKANVHYQNVTFTGQTQTQLLHPAGGIVHLGLGGTSPAAPYRCYIDGALVSNAACQLNFEDTGLYFEVPDTSSCKTSNQFNLYAVTKNTQTQQCQPLFTNQSRSINFSFDYERPSSVNNPAKLTLSSVNAPAQTKTISGGSIQNMNVQFDANGVASLTARYPEAGVVRLNAQYLHFVTQPSGATESLFLTHSDTFTAAPAGFHFSPMNHVRCDSSDPYDPNCAIFAKAGEPFAMQVMAACWQTDNDSDFSDNGALQNFEYASLQFDVKVEQPSTGADGALGVTAADFKITANDTGLKIDNQSWSEVGTMKVSLAADLHYEGVTIDAGRSSSEIFGRFTPAYLDIKGNVPQLAASCQHFSYLEQPFGFIAGLEPRIEVAGYSTLGTVTSNYQIGQWWRYRHRDLAEQNPWSGRRYQDQSGSANLADFAFPALSGRVNYQLSPNVAELRDSELKYVRTPAPLVPFEGQFYLELSSLDVSDEDGICYQASAAGSCLPYRFDEIGKGQGVEFRYGRLRLENGYGPETESLRLPLRSEYVTSIDAQGLANWETNQQDNCTVYQTVSSSDPGEGAVSGLNMQFPAGFSAINAYSDPNLSSQLGSLGLGQGYLYFAVPSSAGEVPLKLHIGPWLKWYWNFDGTAPDTLYDPRATAYFGTYRGHDKVIFWREVQ